MPPITLASLMDESRLPTIPAVAVEILGLVQQPELEIDLLAGAIGRDPALAARVLKTANSGYYGRPRSVTLVRDAVIVMGLRTVKTLALGFSLVGAMRPNGRSGNNEAWQRSLLMAAGARGIATRAGYSCTEEAFLGGLLSNIGVIALEQTLGDEYRRTVAPAGGDPGKQRALERTRYGFDHCEAGAMLAERWNLPEALVTAIRYHPAPDSAPAEYRELVRCVATAEAAADLALGREPAGALVRFRWDCGQLFGIPPQDVDEMVGRAIDGAGVLAAMLDVEARKIDSHEVIERAREALLRITLESERENAKLQAERERLATEAATDPLTGLANRRHLQDFLGEQYRISSRYGTPLGVVMLDIDHFKLVNDEHGHLTGDQVLREVGLVLRETCREADLCARYGGEEFVVVLPATGLEGAMEVGERIRATMQSRALLSGGSAPLHVTVSVGVTAYRSGGQANADWLIKEADLAMYEAKAAGRNTVRCFEEAEPLSAWSIAS